MKLPGQREPDDGFSRVVANNIEALLERRRVRKEREPLSQVIADRITGFVGSMAFVCLHLVLFGTWILASTGKTPLPRFDPSLVLLAMFASVEAIFLSTFILITQNRMQQAADRRADLNLHISLLAERETTRLLRLAAAIARKTGVSTDDEELVELMQDVSPEKVMDAVERSNAEHEAKRGS